MSPSSGNARDESAAKSGYTADEPDIEILLAEAEPGELLTPRAVADLLFVDRKTVFRWERSGKLASFRTPGGQRRYRKADVLAIVSGAFSDHTQQPDSSGARTGRGGVKTPLVPVPSKEEAAMAVVAEAVAIAMEAEALVAAETVAQIAEAVAAAAEKAAVAAERARGARAFAAAQAAHIIAREAAETAIRVQRQADLAASQVARAGAMAIEHLLDSRADIDPAGMAILMAEGVLAAAEAAAIDTSRAANVVASAVAAAAARVARTASVSERAYDREVTSVADALHSLSAVTAERAATDTQGRAECVAITASEAAAALRAPHPEGDIS